MSVWRHLAGYWLSVSVSFAVYHAGGALWQLRLPAQVICPEFPFFAWLCPAFQEKLWVAGLNAALAVTIHEGAHALAARRAGAYAHLSNIAGWAVASSILACGGVFIAAPAISWTGARHGSAQQATVALTGPVASLAAALGWFALLSVVMLYQVAVPPWWLYAGYVGFRMNAMLGLSSLLPVAPFDGAVSWQAQPMRYGLIVAVGLVLTFALGNEQILQWLLHIVSK